MDNDTAIKRLSALAQETRLQIFRLLVRKGPEGIPAGDLARKLEIAPNTCSAHLLILSNAGLIGARREGRSIIYSVKFEAMRDLLVYLSEDCCEGNAEVCTPLSQALAQIACGPGKKGSRSCGPSVRGRNRARQ